MSKQWILDQTAKTEPAHGCPPEDRNIEQMLSASFILLDKPAGPHRTNSQHGQRICLDLKRWGTEAP